MYQPTEALEHFQWNGKIKEVKNHGSGHINDTYRVVLEAEDGSESNVVLQRINTHVFTRPVELMENVLRVTAFLREKIIGYGGDPERETLNVIPALDGKSYYVDAEGTYWRSYQFIDDVCMEKEFKIFN